MYQLVSFLKSFFKKEQSVRFIQTASTAFLEDPDDLDVLDDLDDLDDLDVLVDSPVV